MSEILGYRSVYHSKVLAVAVKKVDGRVDDKIQYAWVVYIKDCPGQRHADEVEDVRKWGGKVSKDLARLLFPQIARAARKWRYDG